MEQDRAAERDFVLRSAQENDVKFIRLWFTDILGNLKGFAIAVDDLEDAIEQGVGFDGASIEGFVRTNESDMRAFPDPATFTLLPWRPRQNAVAPMFCDIRTPAGDAFDGDPRNALKRSLERLAQRGEVRRKIVLAGDRSESVINDLATLLSISKGAGP